MTPYAVDNERFARQAEALRNSKSAIRNQWRIPEDAFCVLFCGKFIPKKRPLDLIKAAQLLLESHPDLKPHLLFAGSGELGSQMRDVCNVVFDADAPSSQLPAPSSKKPRASFAGFLNQTEISRAYVAADVLVLPSDYSETWGLVVNEANASGLGAIISDRCGCAPDLGSNAGNAVFRFGDLAGLAGAVADRSDHRSGRVDQPPSLQATAEVVNELCRNS
jgi:glycosyltransferase involved in cell wall biosynthesis